MPPSTLLLPEENTLKLVQQELLLNKETCDLREKLAHKRDTLIKLVASESLPDKLGLTRVPFAPRKTPQEALKDEILALNTRIQAKALEWKSIKGQLEQLLEDFLVREDPVFTRVCRTFGVIAECRAILVNLRNRTTDYLPRLGQLRGSLSTGYNSQTQSYSPITIELISAASQAALTVDASIYKLQEREHLMAEILEDSFASETTVPEMIPMYLGDLTESLKSLDLDDANTTIHQILRLCESTLQEHCPAYEVKLAQAEHAIRNACITHVDGYWQELRQHTWAKMQQADPMPRRSRIAESHPVPSQPSSHKAVSVSHHDSPPAHAIPNHHDDASDGGRGLTNDYFVNGGTRRSTLKLRPKAN